MALLFYARKLAVPGFQYGVNAKIIRRVIGQFANSWGFGFDVGLQFKRNDWQFGLMVRDITTTYNVWNIDEKVPENCRRSAWAKSRTTGKYGDYSSQSPNGTFKKNSLSVMTTALWLQPISI
jgi:hypothetical protein